MSTSSRSWPIEISRRVDGEPWKVRVVEIKGAAPGPTTAFMAGVYGDKPLGCLALLEVERRLAQSDLKGTVILVPAANPPALSVGTRINPDHLYLNRRFPGQPAGFLTDQLAHHLFRQLTGLADCIVDVHSGTPTLGLGYIYDYGDPEFTASFGYLPMIVGRPIEGQFSVAATAAGIRSSLPEFGGGSVGETTIGVEGCLNVLRCRGQLGGAMTGPKRLPRIERYRSFSPSVSGIMQTPFSAADLGKPVGKGVIGWVCSAATGERLQEFTVEDEGAILLLVATTPTITTPGSFALTLGFPSGEVEVPQV
jgi:predicted deacylase